jgi:4-hydroxy-tetrahydrodipicolinate synthase
MTKENIFRGVWTALVTPFMDDGSLDWAAFEKLLQRQIDGGVSGVVVFGTTGESPTLSVQEKLSLIKKAKVQSGGKIRIMAGAGSSHTQQTVELSRLSEEAGAESLLNVTPPYNKPSLAGLVGHYKAICDAVSIPICLYHVPGRTAQFLTVPMLQELCSLPQVQSVKEASGDLGYFARAAAVCQSDFLTGDDPTFLASLAVGGQGVISVISNVFPEATVAIQTAFEQGNHKLALAINQALMPMIDALFIEANPCPTKFLMSRMGLCRPSLRLPLAPVLQKSEQTIAKIYDETCPKLESLIK